MYLATEVEDRGASILFRTNVDAVRGSGREAKKQINFKVGTEMIIQFLVGNDLPKPVLKIWKN